MVSMVWSSVVSLVADDDVSQAHVGIQPNHSQQLFLANPVDLPEPPEQLLAGIRRNAIRQLEGSGGERKGLRGRD